MQAPPHLPQPCPPDAAGRELCGPEEFPLRLPCGHQAHRGWSWDPHPSSLEAHSLGRLGGWAAGRSAGSPVVSHPAAQPGAPGCLWPVGSWSGETASCHHGATHSPHQGLAPPGDAVGVCSITFKGVEQGGPLSLSF